MATAVVNLTNAMLSSKATYDCALSSSHQPLLVEPSTVWECACKAWLILCAYLLLLSFLRPGPPVPKAWLPLQILQALKAQLTPAEGVENKSWLQVWIWPALKSIWPPGGANPRLSGDIGTGSSQPPSQMVPPDTFADSKFHRAEALSFSEAKQQAYDILSASIGSSSLSPCIALSAMFPGQIELCFLARSWMTLSWQLCPGTSSACIGGLILAMPL